MNNLLANVCELDEERFSHGNLHEPARVVGRVDMGQEITEMPIQEQIL
jgi:hypothetical protein